jgi:acetyl esterase
MNLIRALRSTGVAAALGTGASADDRVAVEDRVIPGLGADHEPTVRVYTPTQAEKPAPAVVYFHGGAFMLGDLNIEQLRCLRLAADGGCVVVSVDYRLAPEHPYPAGVEDCYAGLLWTAAHADDLGVDASRIAVAGSSAGGALAAAVALMARDSKGPALAFQMLIYPVIDDRMATVSMRTGEATPLFRRADAEVMWRCYLGDDPGNVSPYAAPGRSKDLSGLPPAYVMVAEHDPLRDEGIEYAVALLHAGVPTELHCLAGVCHGFDLIVPHSAVGRRALDEQVDAMRRALT